ncbi:hypothetical protein KP509_16G024000 [Ceratopteris richardii]|uniref:Bet v I/Major latex protein domain-containing protein n=1 Tax=Ceratopteris richardii TaxID=49495 RepID=A0A8T2T1N6_CERRI|nr:hypothetical protein KP509_16G024000 [Ceratopteris richardii]KAH7387464.1 hypothetical protein KP509_16G024000 [Ceratopteris richardii]KAH7387465.1 hypothetical protein KP509_16G024000 [Ceratopteris richardii]
MAVLGTNQDPTSKESISTGGSCIVECDGKEAARSDATVLVADTNTNKEIHVMVDGIKEDRCSRTTSTIRVELGIGVEDMWPALKNAVNLIVEHCPDFMRSCEMLHGDGGPGSIRLVKFGPASGLVTYAKEEIIEVDEENMKLTYLLLEGDLKKQFELFKPSLSLERVALQECKDLNEAIEAQSKCIATWVLQYKVQEGVPSPNIELLNEGAKLFFKLLESLVNTIKEPTPQVMNKTTSPIDLSA